MSEHGVSLEPRRSAALLADLLARREGYLPEWRPSDGDLGSAVLDAAAGMLDALAVRLDGVPEKHLTVLLDLLGLSLLPAGAARAPVVLDPPPGVREVVVPKGTRLAARIPTRSEPVVFETVHEVSVTSSALAEVWAVDPGRDAAADHRADALAGRTFSAFAGFAPVLHDLYLAHDRLFAFTGRSVVELDVRLRVAASEPLTIDWSWWDGEMWRPFAPPAVAGEVGDDRSVDGTTGFTRSGVVRLVAPCGESKSGVVDDIDGMWVRGRVRGPIAPRLDLIVPEIARLGVRTVMEWRASTQDARASGAGAPSAVTATVWSDGAILAGATITTERLDTGERHSLVTGAGGTVSFQAVAGARYRLALGASPGDGDFGAPMTIGDAPVAVDVVEQRGLAPDAGVGDGRNLDLTKSFRPLGPAPQPGATMYLACEALFAKAGAEVVVRLRRPRTVEEEADDLGGGQAARVAAARRLLDDLLQGLRTISATIVGPTGVAVLLAGAQALGAATTAVDQWYPGLVTAVQRSRVLIRDASQNVPQVLSFWAVLKSANPAAVVNLLTGQRDREAHEKAADLEMQLGRAMAALTGDPSGLNIAIQAVVDAKGPDLLTLDLARIQLLTTILIASFPDRSIVTGARPPALDLEPGGLLAGLAARLAAAAAALHAAADDLNDLIAQFEAFDPSMIAPVFGSPDEELTSARIAWEYWSGGRWAVLVAPGNDPAANLSASGDVSFVVPLDWEPSIVNGKEHRWLRARLASGAFAKARLISWTDPQTKVVNFLPVVEPRPPVLDACELYFRHVSNAEPVQRAVTCNDFGWSDETVGVLWPSGGFTPFRTTEDRSPALYLGFDGPLPAAAIGLFVDVDPQAGRGGNPVPLRPIWEGFDGAAWQPLSVDDGTRGFTGAGVVRVVWPGDTGPRPLALLSAKGSAIVPAEPGSSLRFAPGQRVLVTDARGTEVAVVDAVDPTKIALRRSLSRAFGAGTVSPAPLARFGTPRTWIRLRFDAGIATPQLVVSGLRPNAVDALQAASVTDEVLGSSDGTGMQVLFTARRPLLAGTVEVRELSGSRAEVDRPILEAELAAAGAGSAARAHTDPRTGRTDAVWVQWQERSSLHLAGSGDRAYVVDRATGRVLFGDGVHGRIPPAGPDNIRASYRWGGGPDGNVPTGSVTTVLSGALIQGVRNVQPGEGGAAGETLAEVISRGPLTLRHQRQGVTATDVEALARELWPGVARARALGGVDAFGRVAAGSVRLVVVPASADTEPQPSQELRRRIADLLSLRLPAVAEIALEGPTYLRVGVEATVRATRIEDTATMRAGVFKVLAAFLAPLTGGPDGRGWDFGQDVHLSDIARALVAVPGLDAITNLTVWRDGTSCGGAATSTPAGDHLDVPPDHLVSAGTLRVLLAGGPG